VVFREKYIQDQNGSQPIPRISPVQTSSFCQFFLAHRF